MSSAEAIHRPHTSVYVDPILSTAGDGDEYAVLKSQSIINDSRKAHCKSKLNYSLRFFHRLALPSEWAELFKICR